jgi:DNA mismatch endonuclease (patch repair protein)
MVARPRVAPSTPETSRRMRRVRQRSASSEAARRFELYVRGLRYRMHVPVELSIHRARQRG